MTITNSVFVSNMNLLKNLSEFLSSLTLIDVIFFFSIILLMVLVVVLLYFIKVNEDVPEKEEVESENDMIQNTYIDPQENEELPTLENYKTISYSYDDDEEEGFIDLQSISDALNSEERNIELTRFEEEQEKDAIISYDELINKSKANSINYKNEVMLDDLSIKEVDLENFTDGIVDRSNMDNNVHVISYAQEEAFLDSLKKLEKQLN